MEILIASIADAEELTRVEIESKLKSIPENIDPIEVDNERRLQRWQNYISGGSSPQKAKVERVVFKALIDEKMVGYIAGHLTERYGKEAEIQSFYILIEHQRMGIGSKLLAQFLDWLAAYGVGSLCVGIDGANPYQQFYLKYGGAHLNPHWIFWDDLAVLRTRLADAAFAANE
jgi:ribosomal protein S18 acetylase RimI-like enzyme